MAKKYQINLHLNNSQFDSSIGKAVTGMTRMEASSRRMAATLQRSMNSMAAAIAAFNAATAGGFGGGGGGGGGGSGGGGSGVSSQQRAKNSLAAQEARANLAELMAQQRARVSLAAQESKAILRDYAAQERAKQSLASQAAKANLKNLTEQQKARRSLAAQEARENLKNIAQEESARDKYHAGIQKYATIGLATAVTIGKAVSDIYMEIEKRAISSGKAVLKAREDLRETAAVQGKPMVTNDVLLAEAKFQMETRLSADEANKFSRMFEGNVNVGTEKFRLDEKSGIPVEKRGGIDPAIAAKLKTAAGLRARRVGGDSSVHAELAGIMSMFGPVRSVEEGMGQIESIKEALVTGRGDDSPLLQQLLNHAGSMVREGGPVGSLPEMAALIATTSLTAGTQEAGTHAEQIKRSITGGMLKHRKRQGAVISQADYLKNLKINENMDLEESLDLLMPDIQKAQDSGRGLDQYLGEHGFSNQDERNAIIELLPNYKFFKDQMAKARKGGLGAESLKQNEEWIRSKQGVAASGEIMGELNLKAKGISQESLASQLAVAEGSQETLEGDNSVVTRGLDLIRGITRGGGSERGRDIRLKRQVISNLEKKAQAAGMPSNELAKMKEDFDWDLSPEAYGKYVNKLENSVRAGGGDAGPDVQAAITNLTKAMDESTAAQKAANKLAEDRAKGILPPPIPPKANVKAGANVQ